MQLTSVILAFSTLLAATSAAAAGNAASDIDIKMKRDLDMEASALENRDLEKRACRKNGCKCKKGTKQGQYCGLCDAVTAAGSGGFFTRDIFECNPSGGCCDYGTSTVCSGNNWSKYCPK